MTFHRRARLVTALLAAAPLAWACVSSPPDVAAEVRSEYEAAARDPDIAKHAALQLRDARTSLQRLEAARDREEIEHLAYVTRQEIEIAQASGERAGLQAQIDQLGERREALRLAARDSELASAKSEAQQNLAAAESARAQAEQNLEAAESARETAEQALGRARSLEERIAELKAEETERGLVMTMSGVLFASGSAELMPGAQRKLEEVAALLNEFPERRIQIEGHTDSVGSDSYNRELSRQRAESVAAVFRARGVDPSRIGVEGLGESFPVAPNDAAAGRQANRRVAITLVNPGAPARAADAPAALSQED